MNNFVMKCVAMLLFMPLMLSLQTVSAQDEEAPKVMIKGTLVNAKDSSPIQFANIGVVGTFLGTASDVNGNFLLEVDSLFLTYDVKVSTIGFHSNQVALKTLIAHPTLTLEPTAYEISAVNVEAKSAVLVGYLRKAVRNMTSNYISGAYNYDFKLKSDVHSNGETRTREILGQTYDAVGYQRESYADGFSHVNYAFKYSHKNFDQIPLSEGLTDMDDLLAGDIVRFSGNVLDTAHFSSYILNLVSITEYNNDSVYVIGYKNISPTSANTRVAHVTSYQGEIFVRKRDFVIIKNTLNVEAKLLSRHGNTYVEANETSPYGQNLSYTLTTSYKEDNGKVLLSSVHLKKNFNSKDKAVVEVESNLTIMDCKQQKVKKITKRDYFDGAIDNALKFN